MSQQANTAISPTREENYPEWYQQVIKAAELAEPSVVRGCMVIRPWGYAIWEQMQRHLDQMFKETGHVNAYFPLFIPLSYLEKEAEHVEGFAKECAVVTHHRLVPKPDGKGLQPASPLEEPLIVRPTSETIIGETYAKWVQSYRDLPILINQWANVVRWEMRTRLFLRTSEFLWQEGHTVHATESEAREETLRMLDVYQKFAEDFMAMPVIKGEKTSNERFPGAVHTYSIEAMMQDGKALQAGTSHFLGQNFARASGIQFTDENEKLQYAWTTSWGVSTRLIGGLIMTHSDDNGLVLPPRLASAHIVLLPIFKNENEKVRVLNFCDRLKKQIQDLRFYNDPIRIIIDDHQRGGARNWSWIKKGIPLRIEIGPRDLEKKQVVVMRRDVDNPKLKEFVSLDALSQQIPEWLKEMQRQLFEKAFLFQKDRSVYVKSFSELEDYFLNNPKAGFAYAPLSDCREVHDKIKDLQLTLRCVPLEQDPIAAQCLITNQPVKKLTIVARAY